MAGLLSLELLRAYEATWSPADRHRELVTRWYVASDGRLVCRWTQLEISVPEPPG
jgi:hypothetical protein